MLGMTMECKFGLYCLDGIQRVDLESVSASVTVRGFVAHLSVKLVYQNSGTENIENVSFCCPIDAKAAVYSFKAELDGREIIAHCEEKDKAEKIYKEAVEAGETAILATEDQMTSDVLHINLGNFPARQSAVLQLQMVSELTVTRTGAITYVLPTVFNPRYCPAETNILPNFATDFEVYPSKLPYTIDITATVLTSNKIEKIISGSDPIVVTYNDGHTSAKISQNEGYTRDHDWSFSVYYNNPHKPHMMIESADQTSTGFMADDTLMINFFPEVPAEAYNPHTEIIFVVDRSGSMDGSKMKHTKDTLLLFLKSLLPGCRFNVVSFGSTHSSLFPEGSMRYNKESLKKALELLKTMDSNMGGTEILSALQWVYSQPLTSGYARQMIVVTDGEVWNVDDIINIVRSHADDTRVFCVGIGDGYSTALVNGIAAAGRGKSEHVIASEDLQAKVMGLTANMLQERFTELKIVCEMEPSQSTTFLPKESPIVFGGEHVIVYARIRPKSRVKEVVLSGKIGGLEVVWKLTEANVKIVHDNNLTLHRLTAKAQIAEWQRQNNDDQRLQLVDLSIAAGVICRYTALVGVDQLGKSLKPRVQNQTMDMEFAYSSSADICSSSLRSAPQPQGKISSPIEAQMFSPMSSPMSSKMCMMSKQRSPQRHYIMQSKECMLEAEKVDIEVDLMMQLISTQEFDGSWELDQFPQEIFPEKKEIKTFNIIKEFQLNDDCLATLVAIVLLQLKFSERSSEWQMIVTKAKKFLVSQGLPYDEAVAKCTEEIRNILGIAVK